MPRLTGAAAFALVAVLLTASGSAAATTDTTSPPVRAENSAFEAGPAVAAAVPSAARPTTVTTSADVRMPAARESTATAAAGCNGGVLEFATLVVCDAITGAEQHVYPFTTTRPGPITYRYVEGRGVRDAALNAVIRNAAGATVCVPAATHLITCDPGAPGAFTLTVTVYSGIGTGKYSIMVDYAFAPVRPCIALGDDVLAFGGPGVPLARDSRALGDCFTIDQPAGTRLLAGDGNAENPVVRMSVFAGDRREVCRLGYGDGGEPDDICTLSGSGPYLAVTDQEYGPSGEYTLRLPRLNDPVGCLDLPLGGFGAQGVRAAEDVADGDLADCRAITAQAGAHLIRVDPSSGWHWAVHDRSGAEICDDRTAAVACVLPAAGTYSLLVTQVTGTPAPYRAGVLRLGDVAGCTAPGGLGFDSPAISGGFTSPVQVNCHLLAAQPGDRVLETSTGSVKLGAGDATRVWVVDGAGSALCPGDPSLESCVLTGPAPHRLIATVVHWMDDISYRARVTRLNGAAGCPEVTAGGYGTVAGALTGMNCRSLRVPAAGSYRIRMLTDYNVPGTGAVYDAAGDKICFMATADCVLPSAGSYTAVISPTEFQDDLTFRWATVLLPTAPGAGCVDVSDQGGTAYRGGFTQIGEYDCLRLPTPAGATLAAMVPDDATRAGLPEAVLVDAAGTTRCTLATLRESSCRPSGPAPFHLVLNAPRDWPTGQYAITPVRVDNAANGCAVLPAGDPGVTIALGGERHAGCVTIPAGQHAAREQFLWRRLTGGGDAKLRVFDAAGNQVCGTTTSYWTRYETCALPAGAVTVLLVADDVDARYRLSRKPA